MGLMPKRSPYTPVSRCVEVMCAKIENQAHFHEFENTTIAFASITFFFWQCFISVLLWGGF